jgi:hypothetical protein
VPKIFDTVLMNDELDLLQLRLSFLRGLVDHHIVVEGRRSFTGKEKPLHVTNNLHLFSAYRSRMTVVVVEELPFPNITHTRMVWLNEYHSRNSVDVALQHLGASDDDVILLNDVDEIPHPRALTTLTALNTIFEPSLYTHRRRPYPLIHKLYMHNFMYDFTCSLLDKTAVLRAGAAAATTIGAAKAMQRRFLGQSDPPPGATSHNVGNASPAAPAAAPVGEERLDLEGVDADKHYISLARMFQQSTHAYPFQHVLYPGGWHLTFFGGVDRIKNKLKSYSHQNFVRQFVVSEDGAEGDDTGSSSIDAANGTTEQQQQQQQQQGKGAQFPTQLESRDVSEKLIAERIRSRRQIDSRQELQCQSIDFPPVDRYDAFSAPASASFNVDVDAELLKLKLMWEDIVSP